MTTYIDPPADQYRFTPPHPQARILPSHSAPAALPAEKANFDSKAARPQAHREPIARVQGEILRRRDP